MLLRRRIAYPLVLISCFIAIIVFNTSRIANIDGFFENRSFDFIVTDQNRKRILSFWNSGLFENGTELMFPTNASLAITSHNSSDLTWTPTKAKIVANLYLLRNHIHSLNEAQYIRNTDIFGTDSPLFIIIVQVHQRYTNLLYLIESLRTVRGIEEALVVFSHDFFSPEINRMVATIRFVRFTQIFFPYSRQIFPNSFPGPDPRDCHTRGYVGGASDLSLFGHSRSFLPAFCSTTRQASRHELKNWFLVKGRIFFRAKDCLNYEWPDVAGNYRDPRFTQVKHHWIWKVRLFDIITLGSYENSQTYNSPEILVVNAPSCRFKDFCIYDDYNWDWSLYFIDRVCDSEKLRVLHFKNCGRVFHTGSCGLHTKGNECDNVEASVAQVMERIAKGGGGDDGLFPATLLVTIDPVQRLLVPPNGGWGDARDRALCLAIVNNRWLPLVHLLPDDPGHRRLDVFEPLIPGVSNTAVAVL
ncbi:unnamed protein product [Taenia asiatica]|uniref:FAS1 domain-containing protein n=1 Tax=Taenia asiatica TaxID=60517 RepID=A0A0R3W3F9_TAEAS|nr:unnamed protein product [Taenia asiatica]